MVKNAVIVKMTIQQSFLTFFNNLTSSEGYKYDPHDWIRNAEGLILDISDVWQKVSSNFTKNQVSMYLIGLKMSS